MERNANNHHTDNVYFYLISLVFIMWFGFVLCCWAETNCEPATDLVKAQHLN